MPEVIFNGPDGRLEGRYHHSKETNAPIALVLHPHPQHGGTMNNRVVYTLYQAFVKRGFSTLRFNFRGVGRSQAEFDNGIGEMSDAASALDWMQTYNPNAGSVWIAGFSFGAWISMQLMMRRPEIEGFISVAPPASLYDFSFLAPCPASGLIVHGDADQQVPLASVDKLAAKLKAQKTIEIDYRKVGGGDHFFNDHLDTLLGEVDSYLDETLPKRAAEKAAAQAERPADTEDEPIEDEEDED
ncbi:MAG: alpha/beta hydrolase [Magnetovibrionaceae bacterium]